MKSIFKNWKTTTGAIALVALIALQKFGLLTPEAAHTLEILLVAVGFGASADAGTKQ